ncbi:hypothetical protein HYDPIDRAFT_166679 [Hydnomerulius pinastri MD-312]|nr:hypothetical protein HYDPIDRAFT_166679 [Hydnomerulius pinastri MD-312]
MSSDLSSTINGTAPDTRQPSQTNGLESDVRLLCTLLEGGNRDPTDDSELAELLARLDSADGVANGVESRLDELLGTLDNLLSSLEPENGDKTQRDLPPSSQAKVADLQRKSS